MRKIGFGLTKRFVKGTKYLYVWSYRRGMKVEKVVDEKKAMRYLRQYAEVAQKDAIKYINAQLSRFEKEITS